MKPLTQKARLGIVAVTSALVLAACGSEDAEPADEPSASETVEETDEPSAAPEPAGKQLYFVDGNTANYDQDFDPGTL